jgi:hypothetical protein
MSLRCGSISIAHNKTVVNRSSLPRLFLGLSRIPHFTTLQKFTERINNSLLEKIISTFIVISGTKHIFAGMDSTGFKKDNSCFTVLYRKNRI